MQLSEQELNKIGFEFIDNIPQYKINKELSIQWYQDENFITVFYVTDKDYKWSPKNWIQMTNVNTIDKTKQLIKELCQ
jgi:hypothetical protein